jgi:membrane associated rhomboid family serine protease
MATYLLILANIAMYVHQVLLPGAFDQSVWIFGVIPNDVFHPGASLVPGRVTEPLTFLTAMFSHGGWFHLASNMLYLWVFGREVEDDFGFFRFLWFYLVIGVFSSLAFVLAFPESKIPLVGASGAISAVLGAYFLRFPTRSIYTLVLIRVIPIPAVLLLGYWVFLQFISCMTNCEATATNGGVAWLAHLTGFLVGMVWTIFILRKRYYQRRYES